MRREVLVWQVVRAVSTISVDLGGKKINVSMLERDKVSIV